MGEELRVVDPHKEQIFGYSWEKYAREVWSRYVWKTHQENPTMLFSNVEYKIVLNSLYLC